MEVTLSHTCIKEMAAGFAKVIPRNGTLPVLHYLQVRLAAKGTD